MHIDRERWRHFEKIRRALREWVSLTQEEGVDLPLLRDTYAYEFEAENGNHAETLEEFQIRKTQTLMRAEEEEANALVFDGWNAVRVGKKGFLVYLDPELLHQVKTVALAERKTLQQIAVEALEGVVRERLEGGQENA